MSTNSTSWLIVGLGNPGAKYEKTRHNLGFLVVEKLAARLGTLKFQKKFKGLIAQTSFDAQTVYLLMPQTYMNLSGESVQEAAHFYKIEPQNILVISDDLDLPPGQLRLREKGGTGGHNGLLSISESLGTPDFPRLRVGIGRPVGEGEYVLANIPKNEWPLYSESIDLAVSGIESIVKLGVTKAMNEVNKKREK